MSQRMRLQHLLAKQFDKRQVQLEKRARELESDRRDLKLDREQYENQLREPNIVDLTEDEAQFKTESDIDDIIRMTRSTNPAAEETSMTTTADGATVEEDAGEQIITVVRLPSLTQAAVHQDSTHATAKGNSTRLAPMFDIPQLTMCQRTEV